MVLWRTAERAAGRLLDAGFNQLTRPKKSLDDRVKELDRTLEAWTGRATLSHPDSLPQAPRRLKALKRGDIITGQRPSASPRGCGVEKGLGVNPLTVKIVSNKVIWQMRAAGKLGGQPRRAAALAE